MRFFRRKQEEVLRPDWAMFFTADWQRYVKLLRSEAKAHRLRLELEEGVLLGSSDHVFGLANLTQHCNQLPPEDWPTEVKVHFQRLGTMRAGIDEPAFEEVRDQIKVRLYPLGINPFEEAMAYAISTGFDTYLAIDSPESVRTTTRGDLDKWGKTPAELYDLGLSNVLHEKLWEFEKYESHGASFFGLNDDSFFAASNLLLLDRHFEPNEYGFVAAVPNRHMLLVHQINGRSLNDALGVLGFLASKGFEDGPGSISASLFWWMPDGIEQLDFGIGQDEQLYFNPSERFQTQVIDRL
jgi:hypothetical protein